MDLPYCHVFAHQGNLYAYDVNSGDVVEVDSSTAAVLRGGRDELSGTVSAEALRDAEARVDVAKAEQALFLADRPVAMETCAACHDASAYDGKVGQLTLSISDQCNLRCCYCLHGTELEWVRPHRDERMAPVTAQAAVREFLRRSRDARAPSISFYGGEPLLELDLIREVVTLVRREGPRDDYRFIIDTNGTLLDERTVTYAAAEGFDFQVSLDGPPRVHDRYRRYADGRPTHDVIMDGLRLFMLRASDAHKRLRFQVTLMPPGDFEEIGAYFADFPLFAEFGCDTEPLLNVNRADLSGANLAELGIGRTELEAYNVDLDTARDRYVAARVSGRPEELDPLLCALFDGDLINFYHRRRVPLGQTISPGACCRPGHRRLHVRADGVYQPCERVGMGLPIGDAERGIDPTAVDRLWDRFIDALGDRCLDCWACRHCTLCFTTLAASWEGDGAGATIDPERCDGIRDRTERTLRTYVELVRRDPRSLDFLKNSRVS